MFVNSMLIEKKVTSYDIKNLKNGKNVSRRLNLQIMKHVALLKVTYG